MSETHLLQQLRASNGRIQALLTRLEDERDDLASQQELERMDSSYDFKIPAPRTYDSVYAAAQKRLNALENQRACAVCELGFPVDGVEAIELNAVLVKVLPYPSARVPPVPQFILDQYDCSRQDPRLDKLLLCPDGVTGSAPMVHVLMCQDCKACIYQSRPCIPQMAIANGNFVGHYPRTDLSWIEEQMIALASPCVSMTTVTGGRQRSIRSHHYVVKNTEGPLLKMLPEHISGRVRVAMVGAMTTDQIARCRARYEVNISKCSDALDFLASNHSSYASVNRDRMRSSLAAVSLDLIDDRTDSSQSPVDPDVVAQVDDTSTYSVPSGVEPRETADKTDDSSGPDATTELTWVERRSLITDEGEQSSDFLIRRSNVFAVGRIWSSVVEMFPKLFPGGCGGPAEPRRRRMALRTLIQRWLRLHHCLFERHEVFLLLAFDYLAMEAARTQMFVRLSMTDEAVRVGEVAQPVVRECVEYHQYLLECDRKGIQPRPPSTNVKAVLDLQRGVTAGQAAHYGSNLGRSKARNDLFGYIAKFGPMQVFFTISPDSSGTYAVGAAAGEVTEEHMSAVSTALHLTQSERRSIAARHPFQCAREFDKIVKVIIDNVLGWDQAHHRPKKDGGVFGVVRAFAISTESQVAGDLHAHCAIWLHGFPVCASEMEFMVENNDAFRDRLVRLVDATATTRMPTTFASCPSPGQSDDPENPSKCGGPLEAVEFSLQHFQKPVRGKPAPVTARCAQCSQTYGAGHLLEEGLRARGFLDPDEAAQIRARQPPVHRAPSDDEDATLAIIANAVQLHKWQHTASCFKVTRRTPTGSTCRFARPVVVNTGPTTINDAFEVVHHRPIGSEYLNAFNAVLLRLFRCNHDIRLVFGSTSKDVVAYICKYIMKPQMEIENGPAFSLAAFCKGIRSADAAPNGENLTSRQRGNKILASWLYTVTNRQEVAAPMAALFIIRQSPFWFSHDVVRINLEQLLRDCDRGGAAVLHVKATDLEQRDTVKRSKSSLESYWSRKTKDAAVCFADFVEKDMASSSPGHDRVIVYCGKQLPDIDSSPTCDDMIFYYRSIILLFMPHSSASDLASSATDPKAAYDTFMASGISTVAEARMFEARVADSHKAKRSSEADSPTQEEQIFARYGPDTGLPHRERTGGERAHEDDDEALEALAREVVDHRGANQDNRVLRAAEVLEDQHLVRATIGAISSRVPSDASTLFADTHGQERAAHASSSVAGCHGTTQFLTRFPTLTTRVAALTEYMRPIPWLDPAGCILDPKNLAPFSPIREVSLAFRLNFWQHVCFESVARHVLYAYSKDIESATRHELPRPDTMSCMKDQLVGFLGGEAGGGKSTVIDALLCFARLWSRVGSVETLSFTGVAAVNISGRTIHSSRNLGIHAHLDKMAPSPEMRQSFARVVLSIVDEISMTDQALLGRADKASRLMGDASSRDRLWGGKHLLLCGDWLQIPPVGGTAAFSAPRDRSSHHRFQGFNLYASVNFVVFLTENMRSRHDPDYTEIVRRMRNNRLTDDDIDILNSRVGAVPDSVGLTFHPIAVATNSMRSAINFETTLAVARRSNAVVFQSTAEPTTRSRDRFLKLLNLEDAATGRIPFRFLYYIGMPVMITKNSTDPAFATVLANGTIGHIVGHEIDDCIITRVEVGDVAVSDLSQVPRRIYIKLFNSTSIYVAGLPPGVVPVDPFHDAVDVNIPNGGKVSMKVRQMPMVAAFALTPEKLQGQTCTDGLTITDLRRHNKTTPQVLYVAFSRAVSLRTLCLAVPVTRAYLAAFVPPVSTSREIHRLISLVRMPIYATARVFDDFERWRLDQC